MKTGDSAFPEVRIFDFSERGHSCPQHAWQIPEADKNVRAPFPSHDMRWKITDAHFHEVGAPQPLTTPR